MADSLSPSASTNPFSTQPEEQGVPKRNCPSPHNPFTPHARASSPGNPFAQPTAPAAVPLDEVLPFGDVCEPMQPIKLEDMFPELAENAGTATTSSATNGVAATCSRSSDFLETNLSKPPGDVPTNHVAEDSSHGTPSWGNNTNNSNHADETGESGFGDGFQDDFGSLSHTEVIFKTGFMDNSFKAVAVTAEEDDLWSSSFMEEPSLDRENLQSSGDQESTNEGVETLTEIETGIHFDFVHTSGKIPEVEKHGTGLSNTIVHLEVDLPNFAQEKWDPWPPEDLGDEHFVQDQSTSNHALNPWAPTGPSSEQHQRTEDSQESGIQDVFSMSGLDPWEAEAIVDTEKERGKEADMFGHQDPWTPFENTEEVIDQQSARPQTLDLSAPFGNPFHDDTSSPFHPQNNATSHCPIASQFPFPGTVSQLQVDAFGSHSDPWSPSLTPENQEGNCSRGSRSPNPFSPVEDSANPFLQDLDLLPGKLRMMNQSKGIIWPGANHPLSSADACPSIVFH